MAMCEKFFILENGRNIASKRLDEKNFQCFTKKKMLSYYSFYTFYIFIYKKVSMNNTNNTTEQQQRLRVVISRFVMLQEEIGKQRNIFTEHEINTLELLCQYYRNILKETKERINNGRL